LWRAAPSASRPAAPAAVPAAAKVSAPAAALPSVASANEGATSLSPTAVRDRLRTAGFSEEIVRAVVRAMIEEPRHAIVRQFYAAAAQRPWWQGPQNFLPEQDRQLRELTKA